MSARNKIVVGALAGLVVAGGVLVWQFTTIGRRVVKTDGVRVHLSVPPFVDELVPIKPTQGGGDAVQLTPTDAAAMKRAPWIAVGAGVAAVAIAALLVE
jgi:hypothetical protein